MWLITFGIIPAFVAACKIKHWRQKQQEQAELDKAYFTPNPLFGRKCLD